MGCTWILLLMGFVAASGDARVQTLAGQSATGRIAAIAGDKVVLSTARGNQTFSAKELLSVALPEAANRPNATASVWVTLVDESLLAVKGFQVKGAEAQVAHLAGDAVMLSARAIDSVRFREHSGALADQWAEILKTERAGDVLVVRKNEALDYVTGVIRDVKDDAVQFELDGEVVSVPRAKVDGLLYHHAGRKAPPPAYCVVTDAFGSQLRAASIATEGDRARVKTAAGVEIVRPLAELVRLDFSQGNVQYLGDLKPESVVWTPYVGDADASPVAREFYRVRADRSLEGGALRLGGKEYAKGLAMHSRTEIVYRLPDKVRSFEALVGIDDRARPLGDVKLSILGDDRPLFEGKITGKEAPQSLRLDISGVNRLKIVADFGEDLDVADSLDLCEARILK
ncbi:MAG: NPCBM/NEW2 domain-containing protein [Planctomycetia bacterium]|nr:NPCBM/NEW2 domain-containing protein [Planctomycetia bacterium]